MLFAFVGVALYTCAELVEGEPDNALEGAKWQQPCIGIMGDSVNSRIARECVASVES